MQQTKMSNFYGEENEARVWSTELCGAISFLGYPSAEGLI